MKSILVGVLALSFGCSVKMTYAQELRIRAVMANPSAAEETEWIAVENTSPATVSASLYSLRDTQGATATYRLEGELQPGELREYPRTQSKITLNNDRESVELLQNDSVVQAVPQFVSPKDDQVWLELADGWQYISSEEWHERVLLRNWASVSAPIPSATPAPTPLEKPTKLELERFSPCTSPEWIEVRSRASGQVTELRIEDSSGAILRLQELEFVQGEVRKLEWAGARLNNTGEWFRVVFPGDELSISYEACQGSFPYRLQEGVWTQEGVSSKQEVSIEELVASSTATFPPEVLPPTHLYRSMKLEAIGSAEGPTFRGFPEPPVPDFAEEQQQFLMWKKRSLAGGSLLLFSGCCSLLLTLPELLAWYNKNRDPW